VPNLAPGRRPGPTSIGPASVSPSAGSHSIGPGSAGVSPRTPTTPKSSGPSIDPSLVRTLGFAGLGIAILVGVYLLGVSRGRATDGAAAITPSEPVASVDSGATIAGQGAPAPSVPQGAPASGSSAGKGTPRSENAAKAQSAPADRVVEGGVGPALAPAQRGVDPRQAGLQYIVIASVLESNADRLVQFCRERGLDAWVVPDQNGRLREITVLPGIPKSELKGTVASELKSRIRKVGAQWKAAGRGNSDFEDHYFKPFNG